MTDFVILQFSTSTALASKLIRMLSHSPFSHADILVADGLLGASDSPHAPVVRGNPRGVAVRPVDYQEFGIRRQAIIETDLADAVIGYAESQIGKPFDDEAISPAVFMSDTPFDRSWRDDDKWYCAELNAYCLERAGFWGGELLWPKNRITPTDLLLLLLTDARFVNKRTFWDPVPGLLLGPHEK